MPKSAQKLKKTQEGQMNENHKDTRWPDKIYTTALLPNNEWPVSDQHPQHTLEWTKKVTKTETEWESDREG